MWDTSSDHLTVEITIWQSKDLDDSVLDLQLGAALPAQKASRVTIIGKEL